MTKFRAVLLSILSVLLFSCSSDSPVEIPVSVNNDLVYISWTEKEGKIGLFGINKNGTGKQLLFPLPTATQYVKSSPNKKIFLAFERKIFSTDSFQIYSIGAVYRMTGAGAAKTLVSVENGGHICSMDWNASSTKLAYALSQPYPSQGVEIRTINADGTNNKLISTEEYASCPVWTPDGAIAYAVGNKIFKVNPDNGQKSIVLEHFAADSYISYISYSPDGTKFTFKTSINSFQESPGQGLFIANSDGTGSKRLLSSVPKNYNITQWSKDGQYMLLAGDDGLASGIYEMKIDGSGLRFFKPYDDLLYGYGGTWSADEQTIAYTGRFNSDVINSVYIMDAAGNGMQRLVPDAFNPIWIR